MKGAKVQSETHGTELSGFFSAGTDGAKETAFLLALVWALPFTTPLLTMGLLLFGWLIWKTGRSALLGWARLERLHRVIEEERWEIEHHRGQEGEELREMYEAKGLKGALLDQVVEILMADDNRLLEVMLTEELGLSLEAYEHPLKQASGAALGVAIAGALCLVADHFWPLFGPPLSAALVIAFCAYRAASMEKRSVMPATLWNLSLAFFGTAGVYFFAKMVI